MIEATLIFRDGVQTQLTLNVTFEDIFKTGIETFSQMGFTEHNNLHEKIPAYMNILGRMLEDRAEGFRNGDNNEIEDSKIWPIENVTIKRMNK